MDDRRRPYGGQQYDRGGQDFRGPRRAYGEREFKRVRQEEPQEKQDAPGDRVRQLIIRIGDKGTQDVQQALLGVAKVLEMDIYEHKQTIIECLFKCVTELPMKTPIYGTLVGLLNLTNSAFVGDVIKELGVRLQDSLHQYDFPKTKFLLRFCGELVNANALQPSSILQVFNSLIGEASDEMTDTPAHATRTDHFVFLVLAAIPWVGKEIAETKEPELLQLLNTIRQYVTQRAATRKPLPILHVYPEDADIDYLASLFGCVDQLSKEDWSVGVILKPYTQLASELGKAAQHSLPAIQLPQQRVGQRYPLLRRRFRLFPPSDTEVGMKPLERFLVEDYVVDFMHYFNLDHKECIKQIQSIPVTVPIDRLLCETVFWQLLTVPTSAFREVYYAALLMDICKTIQTFPPALGEAMGLFFDRLPTMDVECYDRLSTWFAHHLINFDYRWDWEGWEEVLNDAPDTCRVRWVEEVIEKMVRLSYYDRIRKTLPESFHPLMPEKAEPYHKYEQERMSNTPLSKAYESMGAALRDRQSTDVLLDSLLNGPEHTFPGLSLEATVDVITHSLLKLGAKSFSHLLAVMDRYGALLREYSTTTERKVWIVQACQQFWQSSAQHLMILLDRLQIHNIVDAHAIAQWVFSADTRSLYTHSFVWDILRNSLSQLITRAQTQQDQLKRAEDALSAVPVDEQTADSAEVRKVQDAKANIADARRYMSECFTFIFEKFIAALSDPMSDDKSFWYHCTLGHFAEFGRKHREHLDSPLSTIQLDTLHASIQSVVQQLKDI